MREASNRARRAADFHLESRVVASPSAPRKMIQGVEGQKSKSGEGKATKRDRKTVNSSLPLPPLHLRGDSGEIYWRR